MEIPQFIQDGCDVFQSLVDDNNQSELSFTPEVLRRFRMNEITPEDEQLVCDIISFL